MKKTDQITPDHPGFDDAVKAEVAKLNSKRVVHEVATPENMRKDAARLLERLADYSDRDPSNPYIEAAMTHCGRLAEALRYAAEGPKNPDCPPRVSTAFENMKSS